MKAVFPQDEIPHLWMHKSQQSGRDPHGNLYFEGDTIYSYGNHFPIARHITLQDVSAVLFTTRDYSATTSRHKGMIRAAIPPSCLVFNVNDPSAELSDLVKSYQTRIAASEEACVRPRLRRASVESRWHELKALIVEANKFCEFIGSDQRFSEPPSADAIVARIAERTESERKAEEARKRAAELEQKKRKAKASRLARRWMRGENVDTYAFASYTETRIRIVDGNVETTLGARVPLSHAKRAVKRIRRIWQSGKPWQKNGEQIKVGVYQIDSVNDKGITAGCHFITWSEFKRIAPMIESASSEAAA